MSNFGILFKIGGYNMKKTNKDIIIGEKLRKARIAAGYTQEQSSEEVEYAPRYIGQVETDRSKGSPALIIDLCNLYGVSMNYVYSDYLNNHECNSDVILGYNNLTEEHRQIVDNTISFLNSLQNKKK